MIKAIEYLKAQLSYAERGLKDLEDELMKINEKRTSCILDINNKETTIRHFKQAIKKLETGE